jgi:hypothetical protein
MSVKKLTITLSLTAFLALLLQSCYKVATVPKSETPEAVTAPVSYTKDIQPLFTSYCATSGCHSSGAHVPDLTSEKSYASLNNGHYLDLAAPEKSELYLWETGKKATPMPPGGPSNPSNLNNLTLAWIQQGAKNN